jgi:polysaccharide pyruvyl transferase WcaK-like protein
VYNIYLLHAYSSKNSGDGVLVKLSLNAIRAAGLTANVKVVCLDKASFVGYLDDPDVTLMSLPEFFAARIKEVLSRRPTLFFGVGGGYLRSSNWTEGLKSLLAHGSQILLSRFGCAPRRAIYLPQSVGPFGRGPGNLLKQLIRFNVDTIFLRDDKSTSELKHSHSIRTGDLVVLEIARSYSEKTPVEHTRPPQVALVFRDLSAKAYNEDYLKSIKELQALLPNAILAVQASGRGNSDDVFYDRTLGAKAHVYLKDVLATKNAIVVSVRLHGSLESILHGVPSVHIAYERKGPAAFSDLGLDAFSFHASNFSPLAVANAVKAIETRPADYWRNVKQMDVGCYTNFINVIRNELDQFANAHNGRQFRPKRGQNT